MADPVDRPGLVEQPRNRALIAGLLVPQHLDRRALADPPIDRGVDHTHAALADQVRDLVVADDIADPQRAETPDRRPLARARRGRRRRSPLDLGRGCRGHHVGDLFPPHAHAALVEEPVERARQLAGGRRPRVGVAGDRGGHDRVERRRIVRIDRCRRRHHRVHAAAPGLRGERRRSQRQLPQHHAQREHVGAAIDRPAGELLGRHVRDLAQHRAGRSPRQLVLGVRDPEVGELDVAGAREEHVVRADIAVHQAQRATLQIARAMRVIDGACDLGDDVDRDVAGQPRAAADHARQAGAVDVLHHEVEAVVVAPEVVDRHDAGMDEQRGDARLVDEPLDLRLRGARLGTGRWRPQPLHRDPAMEARDPDVARQVDLAHPAGADRLADLVRSQPVRGGRHPRSP